MFVNRAALIGNIAPERDKGGLKSGGAVNNDEFGGFQPTLVQVVKELTPGGCALPPYSL